MAVDRGGEHGRPQFPALIENPCGPELRMVRQFVRLRGSQIGLPLFSELTDVMDVCKRLGPPFHPKRPGKMTGAAFYTVDVAAVGLAPTGILIKTGKRSLGWHVGAYNRSLPTHYPLCDILRHTCPF